MKTKEIDGEFLRIIKTARTKKSINKAVERGLWPLVKEVEYTEKFYSKVRVLQDNETGEISLSGDFRYRGSSDSTAVTGWRKKFDYPKSPFAAYLLPNDLQAGEVVYLQDVIENIEAGSWNQGDCWRLTETVATWNGEEFEIEYKRPNQMMG